MPWKGIFCLMAYLVLISILFLLLQKKAGPTGIKTGQEVFPFKYYDWNNRLIHPPHVTGTTVLCFQSMQCVCCMNSIESLTNYCNIVLREHPDIQLCIFYPRHEKELVGKTYKSSNIRKYIFFVKTKELPPEFKNQKIPLMLFLRNQVITRIVQGKSVAAMLKRQPDPFGMIKHNQKKDVNQILQKIGGRKISDSKEYVQKSKYECGYMALKILFDEMNMNTKKLRRYKENIHSFTLYELKKISEQCGLKCQGWAANFYELINFASLPLITMILDEHYVVITQISTNHITARDPELGEIRYTFQNFKEIWNPVILLFNRDKETQNHNRRF